MQPSVVVIVECNYSVSRGKKQMDHRAIVLLPVCICS